ncbi:hypothetical protein Fot_32397 [Forsythia ovata]|uniref:Uncharacterized protein n=1 Tax=Forsythia ovata TaxID=205694 RepID=A0ABD1T7U6_9LAMI
MIERRKIEKNGQRIFYSNGTKLQPRRSKKKSNAAPEAQPLPSVFQFMPTPGVGLSDVVVYNNTRPAIDDPQSSRIDKDVAFASNDVIEVQNQSMSVDNMDNELKLDKVNGRDYVS